jgi:hypothetical protein
MGLCCLLASLEKLYIIITFMRPVLEYGGIVWGGCNNRENYQLEEVQRLAIRGVTGAKRGNSHNKLMDEVG